MNTAIADQQGVHATIADQLEVEFLQAFHADFRSALLMFRKSVINVVYRLQFPQSQCLPDLLATLHDPADGDSLAKALDFRLWLRNAPPEEVKNHGVYRHLVTQQAQLQKLVSKALSSAAAGQLDEALMLSLLQKLNELEQTADRLISGVTTSLTDIDELTGLLNRTALEKHLAAPEHLISEGEVTVIAMLDADYFKAVNDDYGHIFGDYVLETIADRLANNIRVQDRLYRYGGEEFMLVLPNTEVDKAVKTLERLRLAVSAQPIEDDEISITQTISIGFAECRQASLLLDAIQQADEALYRAKEQGRDRTVS